jgi:hypothetical protein
MIEVAFIGNVNCLNFDGSKSAIPPPARGYARLWIRLFACGIPQSTMHSRQYHGLCGRGHHLNLKRVSDTQIAQVNEQRIALKA